MSDSILNTIKSMLGIGLDDSSFDVDIKMHINTCLDVLTQLGVGSTDGLVVEDASQKWTDFFGEDKKFPMAISYIYTKVRILFDPPTSSFVLEALNREATQFEWRMNVKAENEAANVE